MLGRRDVLLLLAVAFAAATPALAAAGRAQDAQHALFGDSGRQLLSSSLSYETLLTVAHPLRSDMSQKKVQQRHEGLELFGHTFVVGLAADGVTEQAEGTYGTVFTDLHQALPDVTPTLTTSDAADIALSIFESGTQHVRTRLVVWIEKERGNSVHLAYIVTMIDGSSALNAYVLLDAKNGETTSEYINVWAIGGNEKVGRIYYNGTNGQPEVRVTKTGDNCSLLDEVSKAGDFLQAVGQEELAKGTVAIYAFSSEAVQAWANRNLSHVREMYERLPAFSYACPKQGEYLQTTDEVHDAYSQQADIQAQMSVVIKMWKEWFGVDVISWFKKAGVPTPLLVIPHAAPELENAAWVNWFFYCGDGNTTLYPLCTAGDVLAHELGHGITQIINGGLLYFGQAGAFNEGFSDMIGITFTYFTTGRLDPMIGGAITRNKAGIRNISDPGQFGQSTSVYSLTSVDPHELSGVPNLAFYKLATSPCYNVKLAMQVAQRAAHLYFTPTISFLDGANAWVKAASDLGYDTAPVRQAWQDVGLWQACGSRMDAAGTRVFSNRALPKDTPSTRRGWFNGTAGVPVSIGNLTYRLDRVQYPCGISFFAVSYAADKTMRPNIYVGMDRMPDPDTPGAWECKIDMEASEFGPTQPSCDLPTVVNSTYYVVAQSSRDWQAQGVNWQSWGLRPWLANGDAATKCFDGGACAADADCATGNCTLSHCAANATQR